MDLKKFIINKKFILLNIFLTIYIITNLIGGERGLASYLKKKNFEKNLTKKEKDLEIKIKALDLYKGVSRPRPHPRNAETIKALAAYRGSQCGSQFAESFQSCYQYYANQ